VIIEFRNKVENVYLKKNQYLKKHFLIWWHLPSMKRVYDFGFFYLARRRNIFSQLLNVHMVNDIRQTEKHTTEQLGPGPIAFEKKIN
jgi:hypothetical protein